MAPPIGLELGGSSSSSSRYTIGALLGQGAFGQVHDVVNNSSSSSSSSSNKTKWACKLTKIPTKITKQAKTEAEIAYQRLWSENMIYSNHLRSLCGTILPKLPSITKDGINFYHDNVGGYRALVLEQMEGGLLMDALPKLVADCRNNNNNKTNKNNNNTIHLGPLASRLMDMVRKIHDLSHLLIDIKPDNFMLTTHPFSKKKTNNATQDMADQARIIDLGLVKCFRGPHGHKPNEAGGGQAVQGTPLYCSLNIHHGETPSRRDDVEALLYLIGDVVRTVTALVHGKPTPVLLPWSRETSDAAIGKAKQAAVLHRQSSYYRDMPPEAADLLWELLQEVREYKYAVKPNYESLCTRLWNLRVPLITATTTAASKRKTTCPTTLSVATPRRSTRSRSSTNEDNDNDALSSPPASRRRKTLVSSRHRTTDCPSEDVSMEDAEDAVPMDIDSVESEVEQGTASVVDARSKFRGVKLVLSGASASTIYLVQGGETESTELADGNYAATLTISDNPQGGVFVVSTGKHKKDCPVKLGRQTVGATGAVAFSGQRVTIGKLRVDVQRLTEAEYGQQQIAEKQQQTKKAATSTTTRRSTRAAMADADDNVPTKSADPNKGKSASITVKILALRKHVGTCVLEEGGLDTVIIGSSPKGPDEMMVVPNLAASHVRLNLVIPNTTGGPMVRVTNLQSKKAKSILVPTRLSHTDIAPGAWQMAFRGASVQLGNDTTLQFV